jgi:hypothetical protein
MGPRHPSLYSTHFLNFGHITFLGLRVLRYSLVATRFTVLTVGVESSGYRMGTRVSLNAIVWVPMIVGQYFLADILEHSEQRLNLHLSYWSPILRTPTSWTMAPPPACRSFPKNKAIRSPDHPNTSPPSAVFNTKRITIACLC